MSSKKNISFKARGKNFLGLKRGPQNFGKSVNKRIYKSAGTQTRTSNMGLDMGFGTYGQNSSGSNFGNFYHPSFGPDLYNEPYSVYEERELFRYFYERDPYVGHGIDLLSEIPITFVHHTLPPTYDHSKSLEILRFIKSVSNNINIYQLLLDISHEFWLFGNVFIYVEKNANQTDIERVVILDPNMIEVENSPTSVEPSYYLIPDTYLRDLVTKSFLDRESRQKVDSIPEDLKKAIVDNKKIELNTNPYSGSFVKHLSHNKSRYRPLGVPILRRCLKDLFYRDRLRQAQVRISMRSMEPKHIVSTTAPLNAGQIDDLRNDVDAAMNSPDYAIVTTFDLKWEVISANDRILNLQQEYDEINKRISTGLGIKPEILFGGGAYGESDVGLSILDRKFSKFRNILKRFVENDLWGPICLNNGFVENTGDYQTILTPALSFTRLGLRDNETTFASLLQLSEKGYVSPRTLLDIFNLDPEMEKSYIEEDLFSVHDSKFEELKSAVYNNIANSLSNNKEIAEKLAKDGFKLDDLSNILPSRNTEIMSSKLKGIVDESIKENSDKNNGKIISNSKNKSLLDTKRALTNLSLIEKEKEKKKRK